MQVFSHCELVSMDFTYDFLVNYTPASKKRGYTVLALSVLPYILLVLPSVTNIFCCTFLSNHASQPFQTWHGAS